MMVDFLLLGFYITDFLIKADHHTTTAMFDGWSLQNNTNQPTNQPVTLFEQLSLTSRKESDGDKIHS